MKTTPIFLFSILLLGACGGPAARAKRPGAKAQAAAAVVGVVPVQSAIGADVAGE